MKAKCYRNLHKQCYSVVDLRTRKVFAHQHHVILKDATFRVSQAGRERVLRERRKNVHAYVTGTLLKSEFGFPDLEPREAYYNPYKTKTFTDKETNEPVDRASMVMLAPGKIYYWEDN